MPTPCLVHGRNDKHCAVVIVAAWHYVDPQTLWTIFATACPSCGTKEDGLTTYSVLEFRPPEHLLSRASGILICHSTPTRSKDMPAMEAAWQNLPMADSCPGPLYMASVRSWKKTPPWSRRTWRVGSSMSSAQARETTVRGPQRLAADCADAAFEARLATYRTTTLKRTMSAPKVKWWKASRFSSDSMLWLAAGNSATNSRGQHQVPSTLGIAMRRVVMSTVHDIVASPLASDSLWISAGVSGPGQLEHVVEPSESASPAASGKSGSAWPFAASDSSFEHSGGARQFLRQKAMYMSKPPMAAPRIAKPSEPHRGRAAVESEEMSINASGIAAASAGNEPSGATAWAGAMRPKCAAGTSIIGSG